ncbi:MAG: hypothetical protein ACQ9MH_06490 [Nitrospinales bacterium]
MRFSRLNKLVSTVERLRASLGKFLFPAMEPVLIALENIRPDVRRHFDQAIKSLENNNMPVGLLNLNMVLSLRPNHFMARVYRGRIFLKEKQFRLASVDFIRANKISSYRFTHYGLYSEYLKSINEGVGNLSDSVAENFNQVINNLNAPELTSRDFEKEENDDCFEPVPPLQMALEEEHITLGENLDLTPEDIGRFDDMGPITQAEIEGTDWENVIKKLAS